MINKINVNSYDRTEELTPEEVRSIETFKDWDDERLIELIRAIKTLSTVMYNNWSKDTKIGRKIALEINDKANIAA